MTTQDAEQHRDDEAEPERVAHPQHPGRDLDRVQVQEEVGERLERPTSRRVELWVAEHRAPHVAALDPGGDAVVDRRASRRLERPVGSVDRQSMRSRLPRRGPSTARRVGTG